MNEIKRLNWAVIAPVGLLALALLAILWLDLATGGEAKPDPFLGTIGTPVRGTFVAPTSTPPGAEATPRPRPTVGGDAEGTPLERDAARRGALVLLLVAADEYRDENGEYPSTGGNLQTLCVYKDDDVGCDLAETYDGALPEDPAGDPIKNGYWYQSDGETVKIYAALELEISDSERCPTDNVDLRVKQSLVCIEGP
ncbi:MAG: hypothetical protein WD359_06925 [Dehalococcoidia bacterium]